MARDTAYRPLIGICSRPGEDDPEKSYINTRYARCVQDAGGIPVALPYGFGAAAIAHDIVDRIDGLLLTGGGDVSEEGFGGNNYAAGCVARISFMSADRDVFEFAAGFAERSITSEGVVATYSSVAEDCDPPDPFPVPWRQPRNVKFLFAAAFSVTFLPLAHRPLPDTLPPSAGSARPRTYGIFSNRAVSARSVVIVTDGFAFASKSISPSYQPMNS